MKPNHAQDLMFDWGAVASFEKIDGRPQVTVKAHVLIREELRELTAVAASLELAVQSLVDTIEKMKKFRTRFRVGRIRK